VNDSLDLSIEPGATWHLTPEQRDRLTEVLDGYLSQLEQGLPPAREDLLEANADLAEPLQAYFQSLDELHDMAAGFQRPTTDPEKETHPQTCDDKRLGDFRLLHEVGRGGMGVVYEAEQISLGRRVALKVLPFAAVLDSRQIARFKHEAQAAGQLNHPNIVSVFAVGVERGVHYYAMQFIDGQPLDRVISEMRERYLPASADRTKPFGPSIAAPSTHRSVLTSRPAGSSEYIRGVVHLGVDSARALHAAHENGIVHRDIKPSNLLLDGNGKVWVTDFGLARRNTDVTLTRTGDLVGTVRYMSPEQAAGQMAMVDHRTDIYSLGATLYELLTLEPAIPGHEGQALLRQIERHDPRPPRQLQPKIPLDLQTVIMKGMSKRRDDRYATADEFADDLQRFLDGKPIVAHPPTLLDRTIRWVQRHRELVATAGAVCLLAMLGLGVFGFLYLRKQIEIAETNAQNAALADMGFREVQDILESVSLQLSKRLEKLPGAAPTKRDLLGNALTRLRDLANRRKDKPVSRADLAITYSTIGSICKEMGSNDAAIEAYTEAIGIYSALADADATGTENQWRMADCLNHLGLVYAHMRKTDDARQAFQKAIQLQEKIGDHAANREQVLTDLAVTRCNLGTLYHDTNNAQGASGEFDKALRIQEQLLTAAPENANLLRDLSATLNGIASLYVDRQPSKAIPYYQRAVSLLAKAADLKQDDSSVYRGELAVTYNNLGRAQSAKGDSADAADSFAKAVEMGSEVVRDTPAKKSNRGYLAIGYNNLGLEQSRHNDSIGAEASFRHALELQEALVKEDSHDVELRSTLGGMYNNLGFVLERSKRPTDALAAYGQAVEHQRRAMSQSPDTTKYRIFLSKHYINYARMLRQTGRVDEALRASLARRDLWPGDPVELFSVAEELAAAADSSVVKAKHGPIAADYSDRAVETLKLAFAAGWRPKPHTDWTRSFTAIKNRPEFLALTF
jgi:serine/threonine protein kinase/tetratricopeptide (TPR) repeat protein